MIKRFSYWTLLNASIVLLSFLFWGELESIPIRYVTFAFVAYFFIFSIHIKFEIMKKGDFEKDLEVERKMSNLILESIPTAIIIVCPSGKIEYVNEAAERVLGSRDTVGKNILEFDTVKEIDLHNRIRLGFRGIKTRLKEVPYTSYTTRKKLILNFSVLPFKYIERTGKYRAMVLIDDISESIGLRKKVENQYLSMFKSFVKFIDAKDEYTGKHSNNVSVHTEKILDELELDHEYKRNIRIAAALHDIGKIGIDERILNKPGKLDEHEYEEMKRHPEIGANLLGEIEDYREVATIIKYHHERWDGKGYPDAISEDRIPVGSQVIAIADSYDAITSNRIYSEARTVSEAISILKKESWKQFNGDLVDIFVNKIKA